jgi:molybdate transport system substrate-binding protein
MRGFAMGIALAAATPALVHGQTSWPRQPFFPPWQHGRNNDAVTRGLEFTVPDVDDLADFHGDLTHPKLVLYVGGNYFFAMAPLVEAFEAEHPGFKGRIYWETLPPGLLARQLKAGGTVTSGNMTWTVKADAYFAGRSQVQALVKDGVLSGPVTPYVVNTLDDHGPRGKSRRGARQTPLWLMRGEAQAGVTWKSEALFQAQIGNPVSHVDIPASQNATEIYAGAVVKGTAHPKAARLWLDFIRSPQALQIFGRYGFTPYPPRSPSAD